MNELQILREIAFYSKYINQQKKQMMQQNARQNYISKPQSIYNKYKYIKKDSTVITSVQNNLTTVLINPNFKQTVLINPHFNVQNRKIHVNPKVLKSQLPANMVKTGNQEQNLSQLPPTCSEQNSLVKSQEQVDGKLTRKRRMSIRSKYKIIKSSCINSSLKSMNKHPSIKTKYKIDRRVTSYINKSQTKRKVASSGLSDMLRKNIFKNKIWKKSQLQNNPMITINGTLYKKTKTKLQKVQQTSKLKKLVVIKGQRYTIASNKKSLKRISTNKKRNSTIIGRNKQVDRNNSSLNNNTRKIKQKNCIQHGNKLRKNNQPCPVYRRYGKCRRKEAGRCNFLHNPNQIFLCKKFLQGECIDKDCLLSHKVSLKKMPTCKYFLEGCCIRNDCPYLHVKVNPKADICNEFLKGFCEKGLECNLRHQYLCPVFERTGSCSKRKCMYPHTKKIVEKPKIKIFEKKDEQIESTVMSSVRYYVDNSSSVEALDNQVNNYINSDFSNCESDKPQSRPVLGSLPSFIPF